MHIHYSFFSATESTVKPPDFVKGLKVQKILGKENKLNFFTIARNYSIVIHLREVMAHNCINKTISTDFRLIV